MTDPLEHDWSNAVNALTRLQAGIAAEIAGYPTPIAGCDAQFNHLLARRRQVASALTALGTEPFIPTPRAPFPATRPTA